MATDYSKLGDDELRQHRDNLRDEVAFLERHVAAIASEYEQALRDRAGPAPTNLLSR